MAVKRRVNMHVLNNVGFSLSGLFLQVTKNQAGLLRALLVHYRCQTSIKARTTKAWNINLNTQTLSSSWLVCVNGPHLT